MLKVHYVAVSKAYLNTRQAACGETVNLSQSTHGDWSFTSEHPDMLLLIFCCVMKKEVFFMHSKEPKRHYQKVKKEAKTKKLLS